LKNSFEPDSVWLVLSSDIGQVAKKQAIAFSESVGVNGIVLTKTDGSSKGGGALAACAETNSNVVFIGTGEKLEDLEEFDVQRYLSKIMGFGDLQGLLEKAREVSVESDFNPDELLKGDFTLKTFYQQLETTRKMGPLNKVADMLGFGKQLPKEQLEMGQEKFDSFKFIMDSMTKQELNNPDVISNSRIKRIAKGSGRTEQDVRDLLKQFKQTSKMMKQFKKMGNINAEKMSEKDMQKLLQKFQPKKKKKKFRLR